MYHIVFSDQVKADMSLVKKMIAEGADVHACDDMGQNLMHEVARYHGAEMCYFLLSCKININLGQWCTPPPNAANAGFLATPPPPKKTNGVIRRERYFLNTLLRQKMSRI